jgi:sulfur-carrier protein
MPVVFIPPLVRDLTNGIEQLELDASSVRQVIAQLDERFPGVRDRLCQGDDLRPGLSVSVHGRISGMGMYQKLDESAEVHFVPAIGGG